VDLFVANDTVANLLLINREGRRFKDVALEAGVAFSAEGKARSGMGVDSADLDQDGWMDLFVANIDQEMYSLYHNNHDGTFEDHGLASGIAAATSLMSGWGLKFFDYDNDGRLDLFLANGHPDDLAERLAGNPVAPAQRAGAALHRLADQSIRQGRGGRRDVGVRRAI
jgi:enediyne biosynthesis protein E4